MKDENGNFITAVVIPDTGPSVALVSDPSGLPTSIRFLSVPVALALADELRKAAELSSETGVTEDDEVLAAKYALACARRAHPGLVDDAALSLWEEDVDAESVKRAYVDGLSVSRSQAVERDRLRGALRVIRRVMGPNLDEGEWSITMDPIAGIVAALAMDDLPEMPEDAWGELVREAIALLSNTGTDEVTEVTQLDT